jgi:mono/diheme cytochrome c family protein
VRREKLRHLAIGAGIGIVLVVPLGAYAFVKSGLYNVAASRPHTQFSEWLTHETMIHSVRRRAASVALPAASTPAQVVHGFCQYETHCVACHGAAAVPRQQWVSGLEPAPPYLLDVQQRFKPRELFWIVKNGIKMTGMPAWRESMTDAQIADVVGYLEASARMPPQSYLQWRTAGVCASLSPPFQGRGQGMGGE